MKKLIPVFILTLLVVIFFKSFIFQNKLPVPTDTIVGLYYPYRDLYAKDYPRGIPFKNFMITDPVRQQYPWKFLAINLEKNKQLPLWNPYTFAGGPLLANFQSGAFYPLNIIFFVLPFPLAFGIFIFLEPLLLLIFMYLFLSSLRLSRQAGIFGAVSFAFGGFAISWLEWGTVIHTGLWLPLILLSIDKILTNTNDKKLTLNLLKWLAVLIISALSSFYSGHLQIFFYVFIFSAVYLLSRLILRKEKIKPLFWFAIAVVIFILLTLPQWLTSVEFIKLSARNLDQDWRTIAGWFVPWQNAIQVLIPDFFGNPATLNYRGVFNYGEFVSYIGVGAVIFALLSLFRKDKVTLFFFCAVLVSIIFAFPTIIAKIPYKFAFPLISSSQPTRLVFIIDFSLSVLSALGFDYFLKSDKKKNIYYVLGLLALIFVAVWIYVFIFLKPISSENFLISKQNLIFPTILFLINSALIISAVIIFSKFKKLKFKSVFYLAIIAVLFLDLLRFGWKYTPFSEEKYLYPQTKVLSFLTKNAGFYRTMSTDSGIFPPNFSIMYKLLSVDGYDPLYLQRYAELIAAINRGSPDIHPPFGFNRIVTPQHSESRIMDLLGVKYILSPLTLENPRLKKVFQEGDTIVYQNKTVLPRVFFTATLHLAKSKQEAIENIFKYKTDLRTNAVVEADAVLKTNWEWKKGTSKITQYRENTVKIETYNPQDGFLVLTDSYYPTWHATIDGKETKIYLTDYNFRGIIVPKGKHSIEYYIKVL